MKEVQWKTRMKGFATGTFISGSALVDLCFHISPEKENKAGEKMPITCYVLEKTGECDTDITNECICMNIS